MAECEYTGDNRSGNVSRIFSLLFFPSSGFSIREGQNILTSSPYISSIPLPASQTRVQGQKSESGGIPGLQSHHSDKSKSNNTSYTYHSAHSVSRECGQESEIWLDPERYARRVNIRYNSEQEGFFLLGSVTW